MPPRPIPSLKILLIWRMVLLVLSDPLFVTSYTCNLTSTSIGVIFFFLFFFTKNSNSNPNSKPQPLFSLSLSLGLDSKHSLLMKWNDSIQELWQCEPASQSLFTLFPFPLSIFWEMNILFLLLLYLNRLDMLNLVYNGVSNFFLSEFWPNFQKQKKVVLLFAGMFSF